MATLIEAIITMSEDNALTVVEERLHQGDRPLQILDDCRAAMSVIGEKFERGESFVPELIMSGEILSRISEVLKPHLTGKESPPVRGKIVIGTVQGDIHDIGKDLVAFLLEVNGWEVFDLGVDVAPDEFVRAARETGATIIGLSGFLTLAFDPMKETITQLRGAGLEENIFVIIGGGPIDDQACQYTGADAWGKDAQDAVRITAAAVNQEAQHGQ